jgi:hypothetical protein
MEITISPSSLPTASPPGQLSEPALEDALPGNRLPVEGTALASTGAQASTRRAFRGRLASIAVAGGLTTAVFLMQVLNGSFQAEFGSHPDEAAHVVTGLMVHDFLTGGNWSNPLRFAEDFYLHYPKVAIGHWPPVFYVVQAGWLALFGPTRPAFLLLQASLCSVLAIAVFAVARRFAAFPVAVGAALTLVCLPLAQRFTASVMAEPLVTLLVFAATLVYARYLGGARPVMWAILFSLLAAVAILTKGNGLVLALVPGLCLLLTRRVELLKRPSFWLPAAIVACLCAPFYLLTLNMQRNGMQHESFSASFCWLAASFYTRSLWFVTGPAVAALVLVGAWKRVLSPLFQRREVEPLWAALAASVLAVWGFHVLVPCGLEPRHLLVCIPAIVLFAASGFTEVWRATHWLRPGALSTARFALVTAAAVAVILHSRPYEKHWSGFAGVLDSIKAEDHWAQSIIMVSSDAPGDGMMVAEAALRDNRPGRYVLRASKMLALARWNLQQYRPEFTSPAEVRAFLRRIPVGLLILDTSVETSAALRHHSQLLNVVRAYPTEWKLVGQHTIVRAGKVVPDAIKVYALVGHEEMPSGRIEVNLHHMLGRKICSNGTP